MPLVDCYFYQFWLPIDKLLLYTIPPVEDEQKKQCRGDKASQPVAMHMERSRRSLSCLDHLADEEKKKMD